MIYRKWARVVLLFAWDLVIVNLSWTLALWARFEGSVPPLYLKNWTLLLPAVNAAHLLVFLALGYHRRLWRYTDAGDMLRLVVGEILATLPAWLLTYSVWRISYPRSAILLAALMTLFFTGGTRLLVRMAGEGEYRSPTGGLAGAFHAGQPRAGQNVRPAGLERVLIVGAGEAGRLVARELRRHPEAGLIPVGFVDDDPAKHGMVIVGIPVLGGRAVLEQVAAQDRPDQVIIAMPSAGRQAISEWVRLCSRIKSRIRLVPGVYEIIGGRAGLPALRDARPEDLLGREPAKVRQEEGAAYLKGRVVLVTGAGGSIGSELCRRIARYGPKFLILLGNEENQLHDLSLDLGLTFRGLPREIVLGNIRDEARMGEIFSRYRPEVVFHAAAHKHVYLLESNPEEAVKNNVFGTQNVALAALKARTKNFVYVSTDKAVEPSSVMGATKRVGELIAQSLNSEGDTRFVVVRFGNVLGSRGSVLPIFQRQIASGGPVTVTHPEATRYFMTVEEAGQLLIETVGLGKGGQVLILDMGTPIKVLDLAENVIRLAGKEPGKDIPIRFTGLRPGEKLHEELLTPKEELTATTHERIFIAAQEAIPWPALSRELDRLWQLCQAEDTEALKTHLFRLAEPGRAASLVAEGEAAVS